MYLELGFTSAIPPGSSDPGVNIEELPYMKQYWSLHVAPPGLPSANEVWGVEALQMKETHS